MGAIIQVGLGSTQYRLMLLLGRLIGKIGWVKSRLVPLALSIGLAGVAGGIMEPALLEIYLFI